MNEKMEITLRGIEIYQSDESESDDINEKRKKEQSQRKSSQYIDPIVFSFPKYNPN